MTDAAKIRWAVAASAVLGALPVPTSAALTALQVWLGRSIARAHGVDADAFAVSAALLARRVGFWSWARVARGLHPTFRMATGALVAAGATYAVGCAARVHCEDAARRSPPPT